MINITKYSDYFTSLHTNKQKGRQAPHKAVLLLSVIDLIEYDVITSNHIVLTERLEHTFKENWKRYIGDAIIFNPKVGTPFWHLNSEPFWKLVPFEGNTPINQTTIYPK